MMSLLKIPHFELTVVAGKIRKLNYVDCLTRPFDGSQCNIQTRATHYICPNFKAIRVLVDDNCPRTKRQLTVNIFLEGETELMIKQMFIIILLDLCHIHYRYELVYNYLQKFKPQLAGYNDNLYENRRKLMACSMTCHLSFFPLPLIWWKQKVLIIKLFGFCHSH